MVTTSDKYLIFEKDLDRIMGLIISTTDYKGNGGRKTTLTKRTTVANIDLSDDKKPINVINRRDLGNGI
jgi:hypothetical protein